MIKSFTRASWRLGSTASPLFLQRLFRLTHWDRVTHICVTKPTFIGSDNDLSPGRCQAIIWTYVGILSTEPLGTNFHEMLIETHTFSFKKIHLKMSPGNWRPFSLDLNVLTTTKTSIISITGYLWGESRGDRWIPPLQRAPTEGQ